MSESVLYDLVERTNGEFYIGVVGSVRSGKSTFIKRFMEKKVLPFMTDLELKNRILDELPQTAAGKQIMTVEPKFIPSNTISVSLNNNLSMSVRLVDCVGYVIPNSIGYFTEEGPRMVNTPWFEDAIPFKDAAEIGTRKVIKNHSNIGIFVTSDGSIGDFNREDYIENEEKIINELKELDKPFVVVLNTISPNNDETRFLKEQLQTKYDVAVVACNVDEMNVNDCDNILREALNDFKIENLHIDVPSYLDVLDKTNKYKVYLDDAIRNSTKEFTKFKHIDQIRDELSTYDLFKEVKITEINPKTGEAVITIDCIDNLYNEILVDILGHEISDKGEFIRTLQEFKIAKKEYDTFKDALEMVEKTGYGISLPNTKDMKLEEPEVIKENGRYGVKMKAIAPSIHMIRVDVESTFEPIIGSEEQSKDLIKNIMENEDSEEIDIWDSEIFGRSLSDLVNDGIRTKLHLLPVKAQTKIKDTLEKIVNKGNGGLIAIIL